MASNRPGTESQQSCDEGHSNSLKSSSSTSANSSFPPQLVSPRNPLAACSSFRNIQQPPCIQNVRNNNNVTYSNFQLNTNAFHGRPTGRTPQPNYPEQPYQLCSAEASSGGCERRPRGSCSKLSTPLSPLCSSSSSPASAPIPKQNFPENYYQARPLFSQCDSDGSVRFNIPRYPGEALATMNEFRHEGQMCDITLEIEGQKIQAHKLVLCACSRYFRGMFTNGMLESNSSHVSIQEPNISAGIMKTLIEFAYTQTIRITPDNVQALLFAATFLEMSHVIEACSTFLKNMLDPSNCIGIQRFANEVGCMELAKYACKYIEEHFCEVIQHEELLTLDGKHILELLVKDHLNIRCETEVFNAVIRWVEFDPKRRKPCLENLIKNVRLTSLTPAFLGEKLQQCSLIRDAPHCQQLLKERVCHLTTKRTCTEQPRTCKPLAIYVVGGFWGKNMESMNSFECYNPRTKEWNRLPDLPLARSLPGVATVKGLLYVLGGRLRKCGQDFDSCSVNVYDPIENRWSSQSPMTVPRNRIGVGVLDNSIYAVGGRSGGDLFKTAERYNPDSDEWSPIADMKTVRMAAGIAVVNRLLYAIGGVDERNQRLNSVECYHPENNEWQDVSPLKHCRSGAGVCTYNDYIYVVGGYDGERQLTSVERFDVKTAVWEEMRPLPQARSGIQLVAIRNKLYILGGYDGSDFLSSVQSYDPQEDIWQEESTMLSKRSGHGVSVAVLPTHLHI